MAEKKVAIMKLKVDLQCHKCYIKVKKVLCKFPQIRDQLYKEEQGTVIIKVVCCSPEKLRDKLCCYGGGSIKSIEILGLGDLITICPEIIPDDEPRPPRPKPPRPKPPGPKPPRPTPRGLDEPPEKQDDAGKPPPPPPPAVKFPEPAPVSVLAYPSPTFASVGGGLDCPTGCYYGRPIYDSYYGGSRHSYVGCHHCQNLSVEEYAPPECTIV